MYDGFVERAEAVTRTLLDDRTSFLVVTTLDPDPVREAESSSPSSSAAAITWAQSSSTVSCPPTSAIEMPTRPSASATRRTASPRR